MANLGKWYMKELMDDYRNQQKNTNMITMRECWKYISGIFCYKAKDDYYSVALKDETYKRLLEQGAETQDCMPSYYIGNDRDNFKVSTIDDYFRTRSYIDNLDEQEKAAVVKTYNDSVDVATKYLNGLRGIPAGAANRLVNQIGFSKSNAEYEKYGWLFKRIDDNSIMTAIQNEYNYTKGLMSIVLAKLVGSVIEFKSGCADVDYDKLKNDSIEIAKNLIQRMCINNPPEMFISSAKSFMCLLLTAFCYDDDPAVMTDEERQQLRNAVTKMAIGEGTPEYDYRKKVWDEIATKTELEKVLNKMISDYYVLPTLNQIAIDNGVLRCRLEAPIGFGKTTFNRAILTCMLRNYVKDERIEKEKASLDALEKQIRETWADIELSNYFPIYVNALLINDKDKKNCKDLLNLAVGGIKYKNTILNNLKIDNGSKVMLIIDGLDEVNDSTQRQRLSKLIDAFIFGEEDEDAIYKAETMVNYIVTSRPIDLSEYEDKGLEFGKFFDGIQKATIQSLNDDQKKAIIDKWVNVFILDEKGAQQRSNEIKVKIDQNPYFSDLSCNPFLLARSVQLLVSRAEHEHTQYEILSKIVKNLIEKKLYSFLKNTLGIEDGKEIRRVLSCLAYICVTEDKSSFEWRKLNKYYETAFETVADKIVLTQDNKEIWSAAFKEINTEAGLIVFDGNKYHWQSETLELFLAAEWALLEFQYLIEKKGKEDAVIPIREQLDRFRKNKRWEDIFTMLLVGWDEENSEFSKDIFSSAIKVIIKYLLDLSITLDTNLIKSIGHIILTCCLDEYAKCYDYVDEESLKLMLRFIAQNAEIIADIDRIKKTYGENFYKDTYDQLYRQRFISSMSEYEER